MLLQRDWLNKAQSSAKSACSTRICALEHVIVVLPQSEIMFWSLHLPWYVVTETGCWQYWGTVCAGARLAVSRGVSETIGILKAPSQREANVVGSPLGR